MVTILESIFPTSQNLLRRCKKITFQMNLVYGKFTKLDMTKFLGNYWAKESDSLILGLTKMNL